MCMCCTYRTAREMCCAVQKAVSGLRPFAEMTARPWNRYDPESSDWWLVPSTEWPAFRYAKLYLFEDKIDPALHATVHVEKGFGPDAGKFYTGSRYRHSHVDSEWAWHSFLDQLASGAVFGKVRDVAGKLPGPVWLRYNGGYDGMDPSDPDSMLGFADAFYAYDATEDMLRLRHSEGFTAELRAALGDVERDLSPEDCAGAVESAAHNDWLWVDLYLGSRFEKVDFPTPAYDAWDARRIWSEMLRPFWEVLTGEDEG